MKKGTLGGDQIICMDGHSLTKAHYIVLQNSTLVAPYMDEHKNFLRSKHPERSDDWITCEQTRSFAGWSGEVMAAWDFEWRKGGDGRV